MKVHNEEVGKKLIGVLINTAVNLRISEKEGNFISDYKHIKKDCAPCAYKEIPN
jgi:hypothetical protein